MLCEIHTDGKWVNYLNEVIRLHTKLNEWRDYFKGQILGCIYQFEVYEDERMFNCGKSCCAAAMKSNSGKGVCQEVMRTERLQNSAGRLKPNEREKNMIIEAFLLEYRRKQKSKKNISKNNSKEAAALIKQQNLEMKSQPGSLKRNQVT